MHCGWRFYPSCGRSSWDAVEQHTSPFQFALSGPVPDCECVAHIAQAMTDLDPTTTLLSVDGIGAFDLISREAMLQGLMEVDGGDAALPFVRQFYGSPSIVLVDR